jgi:triphosphatase
MPIIMTLSGIIPGPAPSPSRTVRPRLTRRIDAAAGFGQIVQHALDHLLDNRPATLAGDPEGVHQMRIAIRKLRTALIMFDPWLDPMTACRIEAELSRIGRVLGEVRNWDIFCDEIVPDALDEPGHVAWREAICRAAAPHRAAAREWVNREVRGAAFQVMTRGLSAWAETARTQPEKLDDRLGRSLGRIAPKVLDRLADVAARRGKQLEGRSDAELHALRKAMKKLRYGIEFFTGLYPDDEVEAYLRRCRSVQQDLGAYNDAAVSVSLAARLADPRRPDLSGALKTLTRRLDMRRKDAAARVCRRWAKLQEQRRFWR